ncbi:endonuclease/exonuclease/phosphatase family protein [Micromonospora sp. WMMD980]|uniref:endonuclease/exonuclease/phosphatase family protein n=1 Tax=Micromonospora sp. WMMD980 TaxID=3016088 RepID=UPI0024168511|nr:endonuclease/exonuclease/phosphatase family protein [Micromonospora sp. WMMD980]MDG4802045.1 endonuclease/exonuclease/phosphatase family protein [Micromonospora sp. WMMD980]
MLRLMTWNIRTGGRDRNGTDRRDRIVSVVTAQRPDVLALQELRGLDRTLGGLAQRAGMVPCLARSWFGQSVAVLVRPPLRVLRAGPVRRPFHHAAARVGVATPAGALTVFSAHLNPYSGGRRRIEAGWLAAAVRRTGGELAVLAGDLNTLEPAVDHAERLAGLAAGYRRRHLRRDGRTVDTRAVARLLDGGLVDLWARAGGDGPGGLTVPTGHGGAEFAGMRLDYLLATPALADRVRAVRVVRDGDADTASDHYPVLAELDVAPG